MLVKEAVALHVERFKSVLPAEDSRQGLKGLFTLTGEPFELILDCDIF